MDPTTSSSDAVSAGQPVIPGLPVVSDLTLLYAVSCAIALCMALASLAGLLRPTEVYPTDELLRSFVANDVVNLVVGLPVLLGSMWLARRGKLVGLLLWPGALIYVTYNYIAYVFAMPPSWTYLLYLALVASSVYTTIALLAGIDGQAVQRRLAGAVRPKLPGGILVGFGVLMLVRGVGVIAGAMIGQRAVPAMELAVLIADLLISPAWAIGGVLLWRRKAFGYVTGAGLLFLGSMLFVGLIVFLVLQPLLTDAPFVMADLIVILIMGCVCFVPTVLFVRGILSSEKGVTESDRRSA